MKQDLYMHKKKFWADTIQKQRESGMSVTDWCHKYKTPVSRFLVWEKRLSITPSETIGTTFKPVRLRETKEQVTIIINGNTITCDADTLSCIMGLLK